jgi:hypothetical protein
MIVVAKIEQAALDKFLDFPKGRLLILVGRVFDP